MLSSLEIAQAATLRPIADVAAEAGIEPDELEQYGRYKAKVDLSILDRLADRPDAKIINVTAITPTPAGEGKTTTSVSLTQGLGAIGRRPVLALREASLGPVFGVKGGAAGGGYAQVVPMEDLNLHFTGDLHAITAANNLLAALVDAHLLHGNELGLDPLSISWRRCMDMNDRSLRDVVTGLGGRVNGYPRQTGFDITAASEIMGLVAVARDLADLRERLGRITVGQTFEGEPVTAEDLQAAGSMAVLLKDAIKPNLVQTLEGQPAFVHCGPFANIAHGNNSLVADRVGLKLGEYLVTESGFASDMGMEKFFDITCRIGDLRPSAVVLVATVRALKHHGGNIDGGIRGDRGGRGQPRAAHRDHSPLRPPGRRRREQVPDRHAGRPRARQAARRRARRLRGRDEHGVRGRREGRCPARRGGRRGRGRAARSSGFAYESDAPIAEKIRAIATDVYGADGVFLLKTAKDKAAAFEASGLGDLPICMAKTHLSLSHDATLLNAPTGFTVTVRDLRPYTGAGWIVALCGDMQTMPGLGKTPAAHAIDIDADGNTVGLF